MFGHQPHPRRALRIAAMHVAILLAVASVMEGCTVMMTEPSRPNAQQLAAGLSFQEAVDYLERARGNMTSGLSQVDQIDTVTRLGVGVGVGGAAANTLGRGPTDVTLGLLGLGALGYALAQTSALPGQREVYSAGLNSLDCIEKTGYRVYRDSSGARGRLAQRQPALDAAVAALAADLDQVARQNPQEREAAAMAPQARQALQSAIALQRSVQDFINATDVGPEMFYGVSKTVRAVNTQLRARAPNLDEIARAGTIFTGFFSAHSPVASSAQATKSAAASVPGVAQAAGHPLADAIGRDVNRLRQIAEEVQAMLPPGGFATTQLLDACQALVPGQLPFRVKPEGPIHLTAGGDAYALSVDSELPLAFGFHGPQPSAQQLVVSQPGDRTFSLAAPAGAKAGRRYMFYVAQRGGRELPDIEVAIAAPAAADTNHPTPAAGNATNQKQQLAARLKLIGLGPEVKSANDAAFKDRVKKLDNCFGITPSDGTLSSKLVAALAKREPVNSAGDCPKPKAIPNTGTAANPQVPASGAGAGNAAPIPKPPKPGASN